MWDRKEHHGASNAFFWESSSENGMFVPEYVNNVTPATSLSVHNVNTLKGVIFISSIIDLPPTPYLTFTANVLLFKKREFGWIKNHYATCTMPVRLVQNEVKTGRSVGWTYSWKRATSCNVFVQNCTTGNSIISCNMCYQTWFRNSHPPAITKKASFRFSTSTHIFVTAPITDWMELYD